MVSLRLLMQSKESAVISFPSLKELVTCILFLPVWIMLQHGLSNTDNLGRVLKSPVASSHQRHKCKMTEMLSSCPGEPTPVMKTLHIPELQITVITKTPEYGWHSISSSPTLFSFTYRKLNKARGYKAKR